MSSMSTCIFFFQMCVCVVMAELLDSCDSAEPLHVCMLCLSLQDRLFAVTAGEVVCCHGGERM